MDNFDIEPVEDYISLAEKYLLAFLLKSAEQSSTQSFSVPIKELIPFAKIEMEEGDFETDEQEVLSEMLVELMDLPCIHKENEEFDTYPLIKMFQIVNGVVKLTMSDKCLENLQDSVKSMLNESCNPNRQVYITRPF